MKSSGYFTAINMKVTLMCIILCIALTSLAAQQAPKMTISYAGLEAWDFTLWSYDLDAPGDWNTSDGNPFTRSGNSEPVYAYNYFSPFGAQGHVTCSAENLAFVNNPNDILIWDLDAFWLKAYHKMNTVVPGAAWSILGQAGDQRTYTSEYQSLYAFANGAYQALELKNIQIDLIVPWQNQAQMRANLATIGYGNPQSWNGDIGSGAAIIGHGFADIDLVRTSAAWLAELDNGTHQVEFTLTVTDFQIQRPDGTFDMTIDVYQAEHVINHAKWQVNTTAAFPQLVSIPQCDIDFNTILANGVFGGDGINNVIIVNEIMQLPSGVLPNGITRVCNRSWKIGSTLGSFRTYLTFDLSDAAFGNSANWRVLYKPDPLSPWAQWGNNTIIDANHIRANLVTHFGEWTIGTTEVLTVPNPVTLTTPVNNAANLALAPTVSWTPSLLGTPATVFDVYCDTNADPVTLVGSPIASPFTFTIPLAYSTNYNWKVVARNAIGNSINNTVRSFTTIDLNTPTVSLTIDIATGQPKLSWNAIPGANSYYIYWDDNPCGNFPPAKLINQIQTTNCLLDSTESMRFYRVVASSNVVQAKNGNK